MSKPRFLAIILIILSLTAILPRAAGAPPQPRILIAADAVSPNVGDVIHVTVSLSDFPDLSIAIPSIHFNPAVVKVCDSAGNLLPTAYETTDFFTPGDAIGGPAGWGGVICSSEGGYPYFNNETGVIGMLTEYRGGGHSLEGTQSIYSVYMKVVGAGSADLRLSSASDGPTADYYDIGIYSGYPDGLPRYTVPTLPFAPSSAPVLPTTAAETVYTVARAKDTDAAWCSVGDQFRLEVWMKNVSGMVSINLPLLYDILPGGVHAQLLDKHGNPATSATGKQDIAVEAADAFELYTFSDYYPLYDVNKQYAQLLLLAKEEAKTDGSLRLNGEPTLVCTLWFRAAAAADYRTAGFDRFARAGDAIYDGIAPFGAQITDIDPLHPNGSDRYFFPRQQNATFEIRPAQNGEKEDDNKGGNGGNRGGGTAPRPAPPPPPAPEQGGHHRYLYGDDRGFILPERAITREEVAAIFYRLLSHETRGHYRTDTHPYPDVAADRWSVTEIATLHNAGVLRGYPDGSFRPAAPVSRGEFAVIAARFSADSVDGPSFPDTEGHWAQDYIATAHQLLWVDGYPDGTFRPDLPISRAEAAKIINRMLRRGVDKAGLPAALAAQYPDLTEDYWAYYELQEASVSHRFERPQAGEGMERWTAPLPDPIFDED